MLVVVGKNARENDPQGVGWLEKAVRSGLGRPVSVVEDPERSWFAELQGAEKAKPTSLLTGLLRPAAWAGYLGHFLSRNNEGEGFNLKGEGRFLGGIFLIGPNGDELWRYREPGFAQYCSKKELEAALEKL